MAEALGGCEATSFRNFIDAHGGGAQEGFGMGQSHVSEEGCEGFEVVG